MEIGPSNKGAGREPRVAIVGSCQVAGLVEAIRRLAPAAKCKVWHVGMYPPDSPDEILAQLPEYDIVISQVPDREGGGVLEHSNLTQMLPGVIFVPVVVFRGFHPDCVYLFGRRSGGLIKGYVGDWHSAIISASYVLGVAAPRVLSLFNSLIFSALGYFDSYAVAKASLLERFSLAGFDLSSHFDRWLHEEGAFMYLPNHPKISVLAQLGKMAAERAGLIESEVQPPSGLRDPLADSLQWPIYPDLARRIGVPGSTIFIRPLQGLEPEQERPLSLAQMVELGYRHYAQLPEQELRDAVPDDILDRLDTLLSVRPAS